MDDSQDTGVKTRIEMIIITVGKTYNVWVSNHISLNLKIRIYTTGGSLCVLDIHTPGGLNLTLNDGINSRLISRSVM